MDAGVTLGVMAEILENEEWQPLWKLRYDPRITPGK